MILYSNQVFVGVLKYKRIQGHINHIPETATAPWKYNSLINLIYTFVLFLRIDLSSPIVKETQEMRSCIFKIKQKLAKNKRKDEKAIKFRQKSEQRDNKIYSDRSFFPLVYLIYNTAHQSRLKSIWSKA